MGLTAIETRYAGHRFRSRLEARWAVFFDELDLDWVYEPEGFELPGPDETMRRYLPDFHLRGIGWFEVKGRRPDAEGWDLLERFAAEADEDLFVAIGSHPDPARFDLSGHPVPWGDGDFDIATVFDHHYAFCVCPTCDRVGICFDARGARVCRHDLEDKAYSGNHPRVLAAYAAARAARFEHGERPAPTHRQAHPAVRRTVASRHAPRPASQHALSSPARLRSLPIRR